VATNDTTATPVLSVRDLVVHFEKKSSLPFAKATSVVHAVCGSTFDLFAGETLSLVGESGCGKTTTGRAILQLATPTSGSIVFEGKELIGMDKSELKSIRQDLQIVFQDPFGSLDPKMTVGSSIAEPLHIHGRWTDDEGPKLVAEAMRNVGLDPRFASRFPNEFSGGQRQRIGIARALILKPKVLILDEPVSALDVSVQAGVINLLADLQEKFGISYLMIAHDLSVVRHVSDRVAVMYLGRIVEIASKVDLYTAPQHPYTQALLSAAPMADPKAERQRKRIILEGDVPSPTNPPSGCRFRTRCPKAQDICASETPELLDRGNDHAVACHFPEVVQII